MAVASVWMREHRLSALFISHIQGIFSPEHGGPALSLANYARGQASRGHQISVRVLEGYPHTSPAIRLEQPIENFVGKVSFPSRLGRSNGLKRQMAKDASPDIYHLHGTWLCAMRYAADEAR